MEIKQTPFGLILVPEKKLGEDSDTLASFMLDMMNDAFKEGRDEDAHS